jgi:hypothetical protein
MIRTYSNEEESLDCLFNFDNRKSVLLTSASLSSRALFYIYLKNLKDFKNWMLRSGVQLKVFTIIE